MRRALLAYEQLLHGNEQPCHARADTDGQIGIASTVAPLDVNLNLGEAKVTLLLAWGQEQEQGKGKGEGKGEEGSKGGAEGAAGTDGQGLDELQCDAPLQLYTHVCSLPPARSRDVVAHVRGAPRSNAEAKDSEWVRARVALEAAKPASVEEILLATTGPVTGSGEESGDVRVLEGTQTNFMALLGDELWTAKEGVLEGTVLRVAVKEAEGMGLRIRREAPRIGRVWEWDAASISSTSRLVMPLDAVVVPGVMMGGMKGQSEDQNNRNEQVRGRVNMNLSPTLRDGICAGDGDSVRVFDESGTGGGDAAGVMRELAARVRSAVRGASTELCHGDGDGRETGEDVGPSVEEIALPLMKRMQS